MNLVKTKMFFSKNVHYNRATELSQHLGVGLAADLGKYLGMPLLHKRVDKSTFSFLLNKAQRRLSSWKGKYLNQARRVVLIKLVLAALPIYAMQSILLLKSIIDELEKLSRGFLWNDHQGKRNLHLVAWDTIKENKAMGGLNIKDLRRQNEAFIMKLCWGILTKPDALWVKCLKSKYKCGEGTTPFMASHRKASHVWRGIVKMWDKFMLGVSRKVINGENTLFWWDRWSPLDEPLITFINDHEQINPRAKVKDFVLPSGQWNTNAWARLFPQSVSSKLLTVKPPTSHGEDLFCWRYSRDGSFTIKSAYDFIGHRNDPPTDPGWKKIWKWPVPEKIKMFLWKVYHERLPSN